MRKNLLINGSLFQCPRTLKKLSLKDYKAKKEAELARKSTEEESSSEQLSQVL